MRTDRRLDCGELITHDPPPAQRREAVLVVAAHAKDAADLAELLALLGLDPEEGRPQEDHSGEPEPTEPASALPPMFMAELAALAARSRSAVRTR
jgi:hypothetical protein